MVAMEGFPQWMPSDVSSISQDSLRGVLLCVYGGCLFMCRHCWALARMQPRKLCLFKVGLSVSCYFLTY